MCELVCRTCGSRVEDDVSVQTSQWGHSGGMSSVWQNGSWQAKPEVGGFLQVCWVREDRPYPQRSFKP